jgi:hypothetical protein
MEELLQKELVKQLARQLLFLEKRTNVGEVALVVPGLIIEEGEEVETLVVEAVEEISVVEAVSVVEALAVEEWEGHRLVNMVQDRRTDMSSFDTDLILTQVYKIWNEN